MTDFLDKILAVKHVEVENLKSTAPTSVTERVTSPRGFAKAILSSSTLAVVAEVKKASPSKGVIVQDFNPTEIATTYESSGASCISVLTDVQFFQGHVDYLAEVSRAVSIPVLRKDFIIDEVQIDEAYASGADAVLLICAALSDIRTRELSRHAKSLGLDVLIEIHNEAELEQAVAADASVIGVNNRDLKTFEVRLETSEKLIPLIPIGIPSLAESGIRNQEDAQRMAACGARGVLVGESLMRSQSGVGIPEALASLAVSLPVRGSGVGR